MTSDKETEKTFSMAAAASSLRGARRALARGNKEGMDTHFNRFRESAIIAMLNCPEAWQSGDFATLQQELEELRSARPKSIELVVSE